jgi:hypothetical protein
MSTLMHVPNEAIAGALAELRRVLAPGALAAVGVWGGPDVEHHSDIDVLDPPRFFSRRSDDRWRSLLATLGSIEGVRDPGPGRQRLLVPVGRRQAGVARITSTDEPADGSGGRSRGIQMCADAPWVRAGSETTTGVHGGRPRRSLVPVAVSSATASG